MKKVQRFIKRGTDIPVCRDLSAECVKQFEDGAFDYIYVDARHDYKGVYTDIELYWPKLREGGIMAGHDYMEHWEVDKNSYKQDWTLNFDGTKDEKGRVVKGAVDDFAASVGRQSGSGDVQRAVHVVVEHVVHAKVKRTARIAYN